MPRRRGLSVRLKLTLSYAGIVVVSGLLLLGAVALYLLRYVPDVQIPVVEFFVPNRSDLIRAFVPVAVLVMVAPLAIGLGGGSLSHRIRMEGPSDEFRDLADVFDTMLEQLEAHVAEQQRFAANASHELRTPLAISQTLLDVARTDPDRDVDALIDRLREVNTRAIDLTEALLLLSRADQRTFPRTLVDLSLLAEESVEALLPLADRRGVEVEVSGVPATVLGSSALLPQLVMNLVANAIVHNRADGAGSVAGGGLGLAIVQRITQAHGGTLVLTPRTGGGLIVTVWFPHPYPG